MRAERHAIRRRAIDAKGVSPREWGAPVRHWTAGGDRVAHRRLFDVGRHYPDRTILRGHLGQRSYTRAINAVVVAHQNSHIVKLASRWPEPCIQLRRADLSLLEPERRRGNDLRRHRPAYRKSRTPYFPGRRTRRRPQRRMPRVL